MQWGNLDGDDVARILAACRTCQRVLPAGEPVTAARVRSVEPQYPLEVLEQVLQADWFVDFARSQGVELGTDRRLTARQLAALAIYMDGSVRAGHIRRLQLAGVTAAEWDAWLLNKAFAEELAALSEDRLRASAPVALQRLAEATDDGAKWAVELTLEMSGRHDRRQGATDIPALFRSILGILDEELATVPGGDQAMLRIASKLSEVVSDRPAPRAIGVSA